MALQQEQIKWIAGTNFMVDGFRFQNPKCRHYFLTHYHSDHTIGLYKSFSSGIVYCSKITAALLTQCMGLPMERIQILPMNEAVTVENVEVTALDANHCPGSVMLLFKIPGQGKRPGQVILHTGDFRYHHCMAEYPSLQGTLIDVIYLDTTYAYPRHTFPSQEDAIATIVKLCKRHLGEEPRTLFVFGSYQIGKERAVIGAAVALGLKVHIEPRKRRILSLLELENMHVFTSDAAEANIHLGFMSEVRPPAMLRRLKEAGGRWEHVVGFRPTGWSFRKDGVHTTIQGLATVYGVPYSEHSSFDDLRACIAALKPRKIIPTVNADTKLKAENLVARFADLMDLSANRYRIDAFFRPRPSMAASKGSGSGLTTNNSVARIKESPATGAAPKSLALPDPRLVGATRNEDEAGEEQAWESENFEAAGLAGIDCEGPRELEDSEAADEGFSEWGEEGDLTFELRAKEEPQSMDDRFSDAQEEFEHEDGDLLVDGERLMEKEDGSDTDAEHSGLFEGDTSLMACPSADSAEREGGVKNEKDESPPLEKKDSLGEDSLMSWCTEACPLEETLPTTVDTNKEKARAGAVSGAVSADTLLRISVNPKEVSERSSHFQEESCRDDIEPEAALGSEEPEPSVEGLSIGSGADASVRERSDTEQMVEAAKRVCTKLEQTSASCSVDVSVDLSTIDNREQAYILRCIEQSRLKQTEKPTAKRKETGVRGASKKVRGVEGKRAKTDPPEPPPSGRKSRAQQGQTLIQSFFWSRRT